MDIGGPISVTVEAEAFSCAVNEQKGRETRYYARNSGGTKALTVTIDHSYPASGKDGAETHLVRADLETFDATTGDLVRTTPCWIVLKTLAGSTQDTAELKSLYKGLTAALADTTDQLLDQVLNRQIA